MALDNVLLQGMGARHVVCGYDFTFGARRSGNVERLRELAAERALGVTVLDPVMHEGEIYSSTRIREALRAGWASEASELLGHHWEIEGVVEQGDQRGRTIGFPTANVALGEHLRPRCGLRLEQLRDRAVPGVTRCRRTARGGRGIGSGKRSYGPKTCMWQSAAGAGSGSDGER